MERKLLKAKIACELRKKVDSLRTFCEENELDADKAVLLFLDILKEAYVQIRVEEAVQELREQLEK